MACARIDSGFALGRELSGEGMEYLGPKTLEPGFFPRIIGESRLAAYLHEKHRRVPSLLDRRLRQKETAAGTLGDDHAMGADLEIIRTADALGGCEHAHLNHELRHFVRRHRRESPIFMRGGSRRARHRFPERMRGFHEPHASPKLVATLQGDEGAAGSAKAWGQLPQLQHG